MEVCLNFIGPKGIMQCSLRPNWIWKAVFHRLWIGRGIRFFIIVVALRSRWSPRNCESSWTNDDRSGKEVLIGRYNIFHATFVVMRVEKYPVHRPQE